MSVTGTTKTLEDYTVYAGSCVGRDPGGLLVVCCQHATQLQLLFHAQEV